MSILLSLSGGLDSSVLLAEALKADDSVVGVCFTYGSQHQQHEVVAARAIAHCYKIRLVFVDLRSAFYHIDSSLLDGPNPIPEGHYDDECTKQVIVPGRNLTFIAILSGIAQSHNMASVWLGVHKGDHNIFPDCRLDFINHVRNAVRLGYNVNLKAPFITLTKQDIVEKGIKYKVPFQLTRTCYTDEDIACGKCAACQERLEAFYKNNMVDPLTYQSRAFIQPKKVQ